MKLFGAQNRKRLPKTLKKHYLQKVLASRFRKVGKPYKTNGKTTFPELGKGHQKTLSKPRSNGGILVQNRKMAYQLGSLR